MTKSSRLIFFGTETFSVPTLNSLLDNGFNIVAIVTKPDTRKGRGKKSFVHPIKQIGLEHNIPVLQPLKLSEITEEITSLRPEAGVLVAYGKIIPERTINLFEPIGIINLHPSSLPKYRGPSPIESTILAGDTTTALSIMKLDPGMDTGPIFAQKPLALTGHETRPELYTLLAVEGARTLIETLPSILDGSLRATPQKINDVSVTSLIHKDDGILTPSNDTADVCEKKIRAFLEYPKTRLNIFNHDVIITSAKVANNENDGTLVIECAGNSWLEITSLIAPSGKRMSGADFLRGYSA